jgi:hypothetical protein
VASLEKTKIADAERDLISRGNACRLLGIDI